LKGESGAERPQEGQVVVELDLCGHMDRPGDLDPGQRHDHMGLRGDRRDDRKLMKINGLASRLTAIAVVILTAQRGQPGGLA